MVSEPIGNCDRDAGNCSFSLQEPARVSLAASGFFVSGFLPKSGWELFSHWDGKWYLEIANLGYSYADDGDFHSVAFYPLFPLLMRGLMTLGMEVEVAGVLINSLAFLGALVLVYFWVEEQYDTGAAKD